LYGLEATNHRKIRNGAYVNVIAIFKDSF